MLQNLISKDKILIFILSPICIKKKYNMGDYNSGEGRIIFEQL